MSHPSSPLTLHSLLTTHSSHPLIPLISPTHSLLTTHSSHPLLPLTPPTHSSHPLTPHSSHTLLPLTPPTHSSHPLLPPTPPSPDGVLHVCVFVCRDIQEQTDLFGHLSYDCYSFFDDVHSWRSELSPHALQCPHTRTHTHACTRTHAHTHACTHTCARTRAHTHAHTHTHTDTHTHTSTCTCIYHCQNWLCGPHLRG